MPVADVEQILCDWLIGQLGALATGMHTERPSNLLSTMPLGVVAMVPGSGGDQLNLTSPRLSVDWYAAGRDAGVQLAGRAHALLRYQCKNVRTADGHVITAVRGARPVRLPYDSRNQVWRYGSTYQIWLHERAFRP